MSNKELALSIVNGLSDEQIEAFITLFASENAKAVIEANKIANDPNRKHYICYPPVEHCNSVFTNIDF